MYTAQGELLCEQAQTMQAPMGYVQSFEQTRKPPATTWAQKQSQEGFKGQCTCSNGDVVITNKNNKDRCVPEKYNSTNNEKFGTCMEQNLDNKEIKNLDKYCIRNVYGGKEESSSLEELTRNMRGSIYDCK
jgi:hypothetical protein